MNSYNRVYVHFVWATWDREKRITPELEAVLYRCIAAACRKLKGQPLEIGGVEDHIHVLARLPGTVCTAEMAKEMKGSSSHLVNTLHPSPRPFRWQGTYAAFSVSRDLVPTVRAYIRNQKEHHAANSIAAEYEYCAAPETDGSDDDVTEW